MLGLHYGDLEVVKVVVGLYHRSPRVVKLKVGLYCRCLGSEYNVFWNGKARYEASPQES